MPSFELCTPLPIARWGYHWPDYAQLTQVFASGLDQKSLRRTSCSYPAGLTTFSLDQAAARNFSRLVLVMGSWTAGLRAAWKVGLIVTGLPQLSALLAAPLTFLHWVSFLYRVYLVPQVTPCRPLPSLCCCSYPSMGGPALLGLSPPHSGFLLAALTITPFPGSQMYRCVFGQPPASHAAFLHLAATHSSISLWGCSCCLLPQHTWRPEPELELHD